MSRAAMILALGSLLVLLLATCSTEVRLGPARSPGPPDAAFDAIDAAAADAEPDAAADAEPDGMPDAEPDAEADAEPPVASDASTSD